MRHPVSLTLLVTTIVTVTSTIATLPLLSQGESDVYVITLKDQEEFAGRILSRDSTWLELWPADDEEARFVLRDQVAGITRVPSRDNMVTTHSMVLLGVLPVTYYRRISGHIVLGGGIRVILQGQGFSFGGEGPGYGMMLEGRYYAADNALHGFYWAPNISYYDLPQDSPVQSRSRHLVTGLLVGWQWFPSYHIPVGFSMGVDNWYNIDWKSSPRNDYYFSYRGVILPAFRLDVGYAW